MEPRWLKTWPRWGQEEPRTEPRWPQMKPRWGKMSKDERRKKEESTNSEKQNNLRTKKSIYTNSLSTAPGAPYQGGSLRLHLHWLCEVKSWGVEALARMVEKSSAQASVALGHGGGPSPECIYVYSTCVNEYLDIYIYIYRALKRHKQANLQKPS